MRVLLFVDDGLCWLYLGLDGQLVCLLVWWVDCGPSE